MKKVYFCNNVESYEIAAFDTLQEAKSFCEKECEGYEPVHDGDTVDESTPGVKYYEVYENDAFKIDEEGDIVEVEDPVYRTGWYYYE